MKHMLVLETNVCSVYINHITKMPATPIYGKAILESSIPESKGQFALWLGILHWGHMPIKVCENYDPRLTLTCLTARSNLVYLSFILRDLFECHSIEETCKEKMGFYRH